VNDLEEKLAQALVGRDAAYWERNQCVAFLTKLSALLHWPAWLGRHNDGDVTWDRDWMNIVFINCPAGQLSWHIHDSELPLFDWLPRSDGPWDGHTTEEKYQRMRELEIITERTPPTASPRARKDATTG
jgi:hypothetical protein